MTSINVDELMEQIKQATEEYKKGAERLRPVVQQAKFLTEQKEQYEYQLKELKKHGVDVSTIPPTIS